MKVSVVRSVMAMSRGWYGSSLSQRDDHRSHDPHRLLDDQLGVSHTHGPPSTTSCCLPQGTLAALGPHTQGEGTTTSTSARPQGFPRGGTTAVPQEAGEGQASTSHWPVRLRKSDPENDKHVKNSTVLLGFSKAVHHGDKTRYTVDKPECITNTSDRIRREDPPVNVNSPIRTGVNRDCIVYSHKINHKTDGVLYQGENRLYSSPTNTGPNNSPVDSGKTLVHTTPSHLVHKLGHRSQINTQSPQHLPTTHVNQSKNRCDCSASSGGKSTSTDCMSASSDRMSAPSDRTSASSDRLTASSDHTSASSDCMSASSDHKSASSDRMSASSDRMSVYSDRASVSSDRKSGSSDCESASRNGNPGDVSRAGTAVRNSYRRCPSLTEYDEVLSVHSRHSSSSDHSDKGGKVIHLGEEPGLPVLLRYQRHVYQDLDLMAWSPCPGQATHEWVATSWTTSDPQWEAREPQRPQEENSNVKKIKEAGLGSSTGSIPSLRSRSIVRSRASPRLSVSSSPILRRKLPVTSVQANRSSLKIKSDVNPLSTPSRLPTSSPSSVSTPQATSDTTKPPLHPAWRSEGIPVLLRALMETTMSSPFNSELGLDFDNSGIHEHLR